MLTPQEEQIIVALRQISQAIDLHSRFLLTKLGLTAPQIAVLKVVAAEDACTPGSLSDLLHLSPQTVVGILNRLELKSLIQRIPSTVDRRSVRVRITKKGRVAAKNAPALLRDRFRAALSELQSWERTQILASLQRVAAMMNVDMLSVEPFLDRSPRKRKRLATAKQPEP